MFDSFTKHHFDPPDIGRVNDYAIQITQLYCVSIVIDPCGILNMEGLPSRAWHYGPGPPDPGVAAPVPDIAVTDREIGPKVRREDADTPSDPLGFERTQHAGTVSGRLPQRPR